MAEDTGKAGGKHFPPHIVKLSKALEPALEKASLALSNGRDAGQGPRVYVELHDFLRRHIDKMGEAIDEGTARVEKLMAEVVSRPEVDDFDLHRAVARFEAVMDQCLEGYAEVCTYPADHEDEEALRLLASVYEYLITQFRNWLKELIDTVADPMLALERKGLPTSGKVVINLHLQLDAPPEMEELTRWINRRARELEQEARELDAQVAAQDAQEAAKTRSSSFWSFLLGVALGGLFLGGDDDIDL